VNDFQPGELLPTWEQLLGGVGAGVRARPAWRFAAGTPRHVRAWHEAGSADWAADWEDRWAGLARELRLDTGMSWREAWAWTALATACAAAASSGVSLLR